MQKRYWLRGLVVGIFVGAFVLYSPNINEGVTNFFSSFYYFDPLSFLFCGGRCFGFNAILYNVSIPLSHAFIGLLAGLLYGKIKNRSSLNAAR